MRYLVHGIHKSTLSRYTTTHLHMYIYILLTEGREWQGRSERVTALE